jgi:hypothetical protein
VAARIGSQPREAPFGRTPELVDTQWFYCLVAATINRFWPLKVAANMAVAAKHVHRRCRVLDAKIWAHRDMRWEFGPHTIGWSEGIEPLLQEKLG